MLTLQQFTESLRSLTSATRFCIAYSGGLDSSVLLRLFAEARTVLPHLSLRAIHINHGLSPNAAAWADFCRETAAAYQVPFEVRQVTLQKAPQESLEAVARAKRYAIFQHILSNDEVLVTGHHCNDQAETLLLQLFRGCGPRGLAAMPIITPFGQGQHLRPLLNYSKEVLTNYAINHQLHWIEDESNSNRDFDRNFIRHELLPIIEQRWSNIVVNLARTSWHCGNADQYINQQVSAIYKDSLDPDNKSLRLDVLLELDKVTQAYLLRYWLQELNLPLPNTNKLYSLIDQLGCRQDASPMVTWQEVEVRRYDGALFALRSLKPHDNSQVIIWNMQHDLILPDNLGVIRLAELQENGLVVTAEQDVTIRFRQGGERCQLLNRSHSHSLKKLLQDWRVPPWLRDRIPLLYVKDQLKAVIGYAICQ